MSAGPGVTATDYINVDKTLTLLGPQNATSGCSRTLAGAGEAVITVPIALNADSSVVDGFRVSCGLCTGGGGLNAGIWTSSGFSGHQIQDNVITGNTIGVALASTGAIQTTVQRNRIEAQIPGGPASPAGVYQYSDLDNVDILDNCLGNNGNFDVFLCYVPASGTPIASDINILNNTFTRDADDLNAIFLCRNSAVTISGNAISGGSSQLFVAGDVATLNINNNSFAGLTDPDAAAIRIADFGLAPNTGVTITQNNISTTAGIGINDTAPGPEVEVHCNRIEDNGRDVRGEGAGVIIDAENNWWGCNDPPTGCAVIEQLAGAIIDADPWIVMDITASPNPIGLFGTSSTINVDFNQNSNGTPLVACFPDGHIVSFSATGGTVNPTTDGTNGGVATTTFTPTAGGPASVSGTFDDETVTTGITVIAADLQVTGSATSPVVQGGTVTKTLTVTNNGPSTATGVVLTDQLPGPFRTAVSSQGTCTATPTNFVTCTIGTLTSGASATVTINFTAPFTTGQVSNVVNVDAIEDDPVPGNNTLTLQFAVHVADTVPTLSQWMLILLAMMLAGSASVALRR